MPDPLMPGVIRAQVAFQGKSGLPEDRFVTTWGFATIVAPGVGPEEAEYDAVAAALTEFFLTPTTVDATPIAGLLSDVAVDDSAPAEVRMYYLGEPAPRAPHIRTFDVPTLAPVTAHPNEVAVCLSFYAGRNLPRQRGRVYLGPLTHSSATTTDDTAGGDVIPSASLQNRLLQAARRLINHPTTAWSVISPTDGVARAVTNGWIDNRFDTQRRRGTRPSGRVTFSAAP